MLIFFEFHVFQKLLWISVPFTLGPQAFKFVSKIYKSCKQRAGVLVQHNIRRCLEFNLAYCPGIKTSRLDSKLTSSQNLLS